MNQGIELTWARFKAFCQARTIPMQFVEDDKFYHLRAFDEAFGVGCKLNKTIEGGEAEEDTADFETNFKATANLPLFLAARPAFAAKTVGTKKLFKRVHGVGQDLVVGENIIEFEIPYAWAKITGIEVANPKAGDSVSCFILDSATGTYSTVPNKVLNQFGYEVQLPNNYYVRSSEFDADIYIGMKVKLVYQATEARKVGFNFILNEVK